MPSTDLSPLLRFLKSLKRNNNKEWFEKNRPSYEECKTVFTDFIQQLIDTHSRTDADIAGLEARNCVFRINRDIRFSKDKSPYKTNFGADLTKGGRKSPLAGYYIHIEPGKSFVGGGLWKPEPGNIRKVRQEIDYCFDEFSSIIEGKQFRSTYGGLYKGDDVSLVKVPQGYDKESPAAEYLKFKSWLAMRTFSDEELLSGTVIKKAVTALEALQPLLKFINRAID
jgi:uncharacterized protein (TIGR02453 family)